MRTRGRGGVKNPQNFADVICTWPHTCDRCLNAQWLRAQCGHLFTFPPRSCDCTCPEKTPPHVTPAIELSMPSRTAGRTTRGKTLGLRTDGRRPRPTEGASRLKSPPPPPCIVEARVAGDECAARAVRYLAMVARRPFEGAQHVCGLSNETRVKERQCRLIIKPSIRAEIRQCGET